MTFWVNLGITAFGALLGAGITLGVMYYKQKKFVKSLQNNQELLEKVRAEKEKQQEVENGRRREAEEIRREQREFVKSGKTTRTKGESVGSEETTGKSGGDELPDSAYPLRD